MNLWYVMSFLTIYTFILPYIIQDFGINNTLHHRNSTYLAAIQKRDWEVAKPELSRWLTNAVEHIVKRDSNEEVIIFMPTDSLTKFIHVGAIHAQTN